MKSGPEVELGTYLKQLRESNDLTQPALVERFELANAYTAKKGSKSAVSRISKFENGRGIPSDEIIAEYAKLPGADADTLSTLVLTAREARRPAGRPGEIEPDAGSKESTSVDTPGGRRRVPWWQRRVGMLSIALLAVGVAGVVWLVVALTSRDDQEPLSTLYVRDGRTVDVRTCPATTCPATTLKSGAEVRMVCFRDAQRLNVNYSSPRWFLIEEPTGDARGWVHSSEVEHQTRVGEC